MRQRPRRDFLVSGLLAVLLTKAEARAGMTRTLPEWTIPDDMATVVAREGLWETDRWNPIHLVILGDTIYHGRPIPLAWQVELSPYGAAFEDVNRRILTRTEVRPEAYAWSEVVREAIGREAPEYLAQLHTDDTEAATCVIWVESEAACRVLIRTIWTLLYE